MAFPLYANGLAPAPQHRTVPHLRWFICGLLFFATTVNYIDRQVLGILKPTLERELGWTETDYGWLVFAFQCAYAIVLPIAGRVIDILGTRLGYALAVAFWSIASMSHSLARTLTQFLMARFALGMGEAANFPAAIKTVAEWFPKSERALATGIFNSGTNTGAIVAPLIVPFFAAHFGWRSAFLAPGGLDLIWIALWIYCYRRPREHRWLSTKELAVIESDREDSRVERVPYLSLLRKRAAWAFLIGKFLTDPIWWFYLFWMPSFFNRQYGLDLSHLGPPLVAIYLCADAGSISGGWLSSWLLKRGWSVTAARKTAMLICAIAVISVIFVMFAGPHVWLAVSLIGVATAAHQGFSANLFTIPSDTFPRAAVGSVVGLGGLGGAVGGMLAAPGVGYWLDHSHGLYGPLFVVAGCVYLLALGIIHLLLPRLEPE